MTTPLKLARESRRVTQKQVADAVGIVRGHYGRIETGVVGASPQVAKKLAEFFAGSITRLEILYPEEYRDGHARRKLKLVRPQPIPQGREA